MKITIRRVTWQDQLDMVNRIQCEKKVPGKFSGFVKRTDIHWRETGNPYREAGPAFLQDNGEEWVSTPNNLYKYASPVELARDGWEID